MAGKFEMRKTEFGEEYLQIDNLKVMAFGFDGEISHMAYISSKDGYASISVVKPKIQRTITIMPSGAVEVRDVVKKGGKWVEVYKKDVRGV